MTETSELQPSSEQVRESTLREITLFLWQGRFIIFCSMALFVAFAYLWVFISPNQYEASAQFAPTESSSSVPSLASQVLGAVKAVGLGGGGGSATSVSAFQEFQVLLTSQTLAEHLVKNHPVLELAFANQWDAENHRWHEPYSPSYLVLRLVKSIFAMPGWQPPTAQTLASYINANVVVTPDSTTGVVTVAFDSSNRDFAKKLLTWMHADADKMLRDAARLQSNRRIAYLRKTLPTVTVSDQQAALIQLLDQQEQQSMMVEADPNYAAYALDPPSVGDTPVSPKGILIIPAGAIIGMIVGICLYLLLLQFGILIRGPEPGTIRARIARLARQARGVAGAE